MLQFAIDECMREIDSHQKHMFMEMASDCWLFVRLQGWRNATQPLLLGNTSTLKHKTTRLTTDKMNPHRHENLTERTLSYKTPK